MYVYMRNGWLGSGGLMIYVITSYDRVLNVVGFVSDNREVGFQI